MTATPRLALTELASGQAAPETTVNGTNRWLEQGAGSFSFKNRTTNQAEPGSPADGDCYLLVGTPTGTHWTGQGGKIALFVNTAWEFKTPKKGMVAYVVAEDLFIGYNNASAWATLSAGVITVDNDTTLAGDSTTSVPSQHAVKTFVTSSVANSVAGLFGLKGATDCSANPNYPAASKGDAYRVSVAGKIGGASGTDVDVGDWYFATADNAGGTQAAVGTSWATIEHNGVFGGGSPLTVKDEGGTLSSSVTSMDFVGAGVSASNVGGAVTVTISGGGGGSSIDTGKTIALSSGTFSA
jgi:hypothetical protein